MTRSKSTKTVGCVDLQPTAPTRKSVKRNSLFLGIHCADRIGGYVVHRVGCGSCTVNDRIALSLADTLNGLSSSFYRVVHDFLMLEGNVVVESSAENLESLRVGIGSLGKVLELGLLVCSKV